MDLCPAIIDSIADLAIVINDKGTIQCTNKAWRDYGKNRDCKFNDRWLDINYLDVCDASTSAGNTYSVLAAQGIRQVISGDREVFSLDYPCFSPSQEQWYRMRVHPVTDLPAYLIMHQEMTDTINYIRQLESLSMTDQLTSIGNRRAFDTALNSEWRRDTRTCNPLSLLLLDIDEFKLYNDQYGHIAGDNVLIGVASVLQSYARRPGDCVARYGGEEFAILLGNTSSDHAARIAHSVLQAVRQLEIVHANAAKREWITVSVGVATTYPLQDISEQTVTDLADRNLYRAKRKGGDVFAI